MASYLVQFDAGKMEFNGKTVTADLRKGQDDDLLHFCWKPRSLNAFNNSAEFEDDLILFPNDAEFVRVDQSDGRVFLLKFATSNMRKFYWMQSADASKDEDVKQSVNRIINPSSSLPQQQSVSAQKQGTTAEKPGSDKLTLEALQKALSGGGPPKKTTTIASLITPQRIKQLLEHPEAVESLIQFLPEGAPKTRAELESVLRSPQFSHAVSILDAVAAGGDLPALMAQFGYDPASHTVEGFLAAMKKKRPDKGE